MTLEKFEKLEVERMKFNAFKVCEEVALRVDGSPSPDGYLKGMVTDDVDHLFFWDTQYLRKYLDSGNTTSPGYHYYQSLSDFLLRHCVKGEKYAEIIKFGCAKEEKYCKLCETKSWNGPFTKRVPQPLPDTSSDKLSYLHVRDTPAILNGQQREIDDYNPRVALKRLTASGAISLDKEEEIQNFAKTYIVPSELVIKCLREAQFSNMKKRISLNERKKLKAQESSKTYNDYDWEHLIGHDLLKDMTHPSLNKYLDHHGLGHFRKLLKSAKIETIRSAFYKSSYTPRDDIVNEDLEGDEEEEACNSEEDEVIATTEDIDAQDSGDDDELDSGEEGELFTVTRSGRVAGTCKLQRYIGNYEYNVLFH